ncbi:MAG TPA: ATP-dependent sacrificial sulfur transferase LarE, partial [Gemmatimonadaceae bacterium]|nr:ATP-dependent sacrificial sulfur transferase LarE [Gemmatimonadaceae bacterium]
MSSPDVLASTPRALQREHELIEWLQSHQSLLLGFSGGVDSAYLACVAIEAVGAERFLAVIGRSASYPAEQWQIARDVASRAGISVLEVDTHEMDDPRYVANPTNRCYFCKSELWSVLERVRAERGIATIIDGTNADDLTDHRPGKKAAMEQGIRSPLAELGFTKNEIRELSHARGIPTWSQPSSPCLSSRLPYGTPVTVNRLSAVERAERALRSLGVSGNLRVRHHGDTARVEMDLAELERWSDVDDSAGITEAVRAAGFANVIVDPRGFRSGSLNVLAGIVADPGSSAPFSG